MNGTKANNSDPGYHELDMEFINNVANYYTYPLGVVSIVLNLTVLISSGLILKSKSTYIIVGNIAFVDILLGAILLVDIPFYIVEEGFQCPVFYGFIEWYVIEVALSVLLNAVDGYIYICCGLYYSRWMTTKRTRYLVLASWVFSLLTGFLPQVLFNKSTTNYCLYFSSTPFLVILFTNCIAVIPYIITICIYVSINITANKAYKRIREGKERRAKESNSFSGNSLFSSESVETTVDDWLSGKTEFTLENKTQKKIKREEINENDVFCISFKRINNQNIVSRIQDINHYETNNDQSNDGKIEKEGNSNIDNRNNVKISEQNQNNPNKKTSTKKTRLLTRKSNMIVLLTTCTFIIGWGPFLGCILLYRIFCFSYQISQTCLMYDKILFFLCVNCTLLSLLIAPILYWWGDTQFRKAFLRVCFKNSVKEKRRRDIITALKT